MRILIQSKYGQCDEFNTVYSFIFYFYIMIRRCTLKVALMDYDKADETTPKLKNKTNNIFHLFFFVY